MADKKQCTLELKCINEVGGITTISIVKENNKMECNVNTPDGESALDSYIMQELVRAVVKFVQLDKSKKK